MVWRPGGDSIRSARKDGGRKSRLIIQRLQLKTTQAVGEERCGALEKGKAPLGRKTSGARRLDDQLGIARRLSLWACITRRQVLPGRDPPAK